MNAAYLPCADDANDPDDWFVSKDGTQYAWEPLIDDDFWELVQYAARADGIEPPTREEAEARARKAALIRRRQARDLCHTACERRLECLGTAIDGTLDVEHGIRGGYYPEQLRKIVTERDRRRRLQE